MTSHKPEPEDCKLNADEREWVHTACKYVNTKNLPLAGKMLQLFDETSTLIGRWILLALMFGGMAGLLWWVGSRLIK
jgi:hypothetical protein